MQLRSSVFFILFLALGGACDVYAKNLKPLTKCPAKNLKLKDCHLVSPSDLQNNQQTRKIHVWNDKIFLTSAVAHDLKPVAIDSASDWEFVRLTRMQKRDLLEVGLWSPPQGASEVSVLMWTVYEFDDHAITPRAQAVIQRRKKNLETQKYTYDKILKYGLSEKDQKIFWSADQQSGSF